MGEKPQLVNKQRNSDCFGICSKPAIKNEFTNPQQSDLWLSTQKSKLSLFAFLQISQWILDLHNTGATTIMDFSEVPDERSMDSPGLSEVVLSDRLDAMLLLTLYLFVFFWYYLPYKNCMAS